MRSDVYLVGDQNALGRSLLRSMGYSPDEIRKPKIGIANSWSTIVPGSYDLKELAEKVMPIVEKQLDKLSEKRRSFVTTNFNTYGGIVITDTIEEAVDFVNEYAPEHMEVMTVNPFDTLEKIKNAGEILLGNYTPVTLCNFLLGPNAILPTGGFAKTYSSVSVMDFLKRSSVGYASKDGFEKVRKHAAKFAEFEGFDTHGLAVTDRK